MEDINLTITNIKLSCKIQLLEGVNFSFNTDNNHIKYYSNFCVIKTRYVFVIFIKPGKDKTFHINITKIPSLDKVNEAISELTNIIKNQFIVKKKQVENLTCIYCIPKIINLRKLLIKFEPKNNLNILNIRYEQEKFPGMFISLTQCTILIFSNGKLVVIGASNEQDAKTGISNVLRLVQTL